VRYDLNVTNSGVTVSKETQIASGYTHFCDPVTFVDAPTGLVFDPSGNVLYVASTADNAVYAVNDAGVGPKTGESAESSIRTRCTCMERLGWQRRPTAIYLSPIMIRL
jgi:DNA-binding beta-propeller fold protein YncE